MNFYASVAMRAEQFPYSFVFQGPAVVRMYGIRYFFCTKPNQNHLRLFSSLQAPVDGSCLSLVFGRAISMCAYFCQ